jgi:hypothetical protein
MWIQVHRDLDKEWLQLWFDVNAEEVEWEIKDWKDDWKIPVITKDMPKGKEVEAGSSKTSGGGNFMAKKPTQQMKPGLKIVEQKKGNTPKKDRKTRKKDNVPAQEEQGGGDTTSQ